MENEKNQTTEGIQIHDIVTLNKVQRTGPAGKKLGYSFYAKGQIGLVTEVSESNMTILYADLAEENYMPGEIDKDYYYTIGKGSEVEYQKRIEEKIADLVKKRRETEAEIKKLMDWNHDFEFKISFIGKLARFIKGFKS